MNTSNLRKYLDVSEEVQKALAEGRPVVALESTIISHGMPYPQNVETALNVEKVVRDNGAVPATIAIIGGKLKVGISKEEIDHLGRKGLNVIKASRRDIPVLAAKGEDGATTVAAFLPILPVLKSSQPAVSAVFTAELKLRWIFPLTLRN